MHYVGFGTAASINWRHHRLIDPGARSLFVAFDPLAHMGYARRWHMVRSST